MKTAELTGAALDWAVAKCLGYVQDERWTHVFVYQNKRGKGYNYSTDWSQGGPIIERERLDVYGFDGENWCANDNLRATQYGPTPLVAAMRCYVAGKLGDDVDVPEELK